MGTRLREIETRRPGSKAGSYVKAERSGETLGTYRWLNLSLSVSGKSGLWPLRSSGSFLSSEGCLFQFWSWALSSL